MIARVTVIRLMKPPHGPNRAWSRRVSTAQTIASRLKRTGTTTISHGWSARRGIAVKKNTSITMERAKVYKARCWAGMCSLSVTRIAQKVVLIIIAALTTSIMPSVARVRGARKIWRKTLVYSPSMENSL